MNRNTILLAFILFCLPLWSPAQPSDAVHPDWQREIPIVVYPDTGLVHLYTKTWEIAAGRVRRGPEGIPASPYLDENCYDDQIWIWDSCFMVMFSKYAPGSFPGRQTLDNLYYPILNRRPTPLRIHLRDNPPLFAWIEYMNYVFTADHQHIDDVVNKQHFLQRHFDFFNTIKQGDRNEKISPNPIFRDVIRDANDHLTGYTWTGGASGMDNTPRGRDAGGYNKILWIDAISQQALSALYIERLYDLLGNKKESAHWKKTYQELKTTINGHYWDAKDGFYYDIDRTSQQPCRIMTPASFWAMMAEIPSKAQAARMVSRLRSAEFLGGPRPWNTLSRQDPDYNAATGDYWRGAVWLPLAYMGTKALEKYGYYSLADSLAERVVRQQLRTYQAVTPHTIWECYNPEKDEPSTEHGNRCRPDFCGWSALGPISLFIENILGFRSIDALTQTVRWDLKPSRGTQGIKRLHFGDTVADILYDSPSSSINTKTNRPFTLILNGKKYRIKQGTHHFVIARPAGQ